MNRIMREFGFLVDSRGLSLNDNDYVLYVLKYIRSSALGVIKRGSNGLNLCNLNGINVGAMNTYMFKVTDEFIAIQKQYLGLLPYYKEKFKLRYNIREDAFGVFMGARYEDWMVENHKDTVLGMPTQEYFFREIKAGNLLLCEDQQGKRYFYGIAISNTHAFSEDLRSVRVRSAFLLEGNLTDEEKGIKAKLIYEYKQSMLRKNKIAHEKYQVGDVYISNSFGYVYLGRINVSTKCLAKSDTSCKFSLKAVGTWLKTDVNGVLSVNALLCKRESFDKVLAGSMIASTITEDCFCDATDELRLKYTKIHGFNCFASSKKTAKTKAGHIDLNKIYDVTIGLSARTHECHIELLDV